MKIPNNFPDDLVDYIYSLIIYKEKKELLDDIKNYYNTKKDIEFNINKRKKNLKNIFNIDIKIYKKLIPVNFIMTIIKEIEKKNKFKLPKPILEKYNETIYHEDNTKLMLNLIIAKYPNEREKIKNIFNYLPKYLF